MQFASGSKVAKLPRLVPLSLACIRRGTRIQSAPAATEKYTPANNVLTDTPRLPFTFANATVLPACLWKYYRKRMERSSRCRSRAAAAAALQWQAVDEAFLLPPPLLSHLGCRHRRCDSDRFAWNKPFRFVRGVGVWCREDVHSSCSSSSSSRTPAASSAIPAWEHNGRRSRMEIHRGLINSVGTHRRPLRMVKWMRLFSICHLFHLINDIKS